VAVGLIARFANALDISSTYLDDHSTILKAYILLIVLRLTTCSEGSRMGEERVSFVMAVPLCSRFHKYHILGRLPRAPFPPPLCPEAMPYEPVTNSEPWTEAEDECLRKAYKRYHRT
jgi:hypothetical protein